MNDQIAQTTETTETKDTKEWRLLVDDTDAIAMNDPIGCTYTFVLVKNGKIIRREQTQSGFNCDARTKIKRKLLLQLAALEKPTIREVIETKIVENK